MSAKRLIIFSPVILIAVIIAVVLPLTSTSKDKAAMRQSDETPVKSLNDTLTNDMSASEATEGMDRMIERYMKQWEIKGASLAVMRNDSLLYAKGYGYANREED